MPLPKLFKNKRKLRREPSSSKQFSSRYQMDAILSQEFVINLKSRAKSPTDLLDIVGHPHILNASSPDLLSPVESSSSQKQRQQRPSIGPRRASLHSFSPATNNHLSSSRTVTAASIATTSTTTAVAVPSSSHQIFQHQESQKDKKLRAVGVTVYNDNNSNNKTNNGHQHPLPSSSSPPALIMPTPKMAVPQTKQMLLQSNNPWGDKTLKEEDDEQQPAGYSRDVDPLSRASAPYELLVPPPIPAPSAPNQPEERRHHRRSRSEISVLYDKLRSYQQEQEIWAQREKEHRIREEWMMKKLQETRTQLKQLQLEAYQQQQSQQQQQRHIIDEAFCDEPSETSDIENEETSPQRTNQNYAWQRQYRVPETYYNEEQGQEEENEENCSYYSEEEEYDDNNKSSGYVSEEDEDDDEEQDESQEEMSQPRRRRYIHQQQQQRQHQHQRHSLHRHHPLHNPQLHPAAAAYYFYHLLSMDHVRPWSAVYHQQQQQQQQLMENRPPHFYYYGYPQPQQPPPLLKRRSRKSSDTSVRSVPSLRHSNSTMSSGKGTTNNTHPRNSLPPEFTGDNFYSWNRTAYL
ncbi:hypothetical protein INT45_013046 [Circinella minor]|uniref:Uncharacterized protein n=1 Tax=Circinella minor TaxID=1195481 RepID=A0A8H7S360_9FUNG|nr:hypothetical protein INT45_013046 [Circinella minor]